MALRFSRRTMSTRQARDLVIWYLVRARHGDLSNIERDILLTAAAHLTGDDAALPLVVSKGLATNAPTWSILCRRILACAFEVFADHMEGCHDDPDPVTESLGCAAMPILRPFHPRARAGGPWPTLHQ